MAHDNVLVYKNVYLKNMTQNTLSSNEDMVKKYMLRLANQFATL